MRDGRPDNDELASALAAFGASQADIDVALAQEPDQDFLLWPDNQMAIDVLMAMQTQWRVGGMAGLLVGLDYNVLPFVFRQVGVKAEDEAQVFGGLRIAELEVMRIVNRK